MGDSAALRQLMDMGIPRGRAVAALAKAKNDVATAAVSQRETQARYGDKKL
jgi:Fe2+ transport system protein FeoA